MMGLLRATNGRFIAMWHDDHEVEIAARVRFSPSVRTEQPDLLGMEFFPQPGNNFVQQILRDRFHNATLLIT